jgi:hypothetical protein
VRCRPLFLSSEVQGPFTQHALVAPKSDEGGTRITHHAPPPPAPFRNVPDCSEPFRTNKCFSAPKTPTPFRAFPRDLFFGKNNPKLFQATGTYSSLVKPSRWIFVGSNRPRSPDMSIASQTWSSPSQGWSRASQGCSQTRKSGQSNLVKPSQT